MKNKFLSRYIGNKAFYMSVLALIVPMIIQNSISNFVSLLDNLMVGAVGETQMNGVSICNQLVFVFNLATFGGMSGATIFGAQFFGAHDEDGMRYSFRYALWVAAVVSLIGVLVIGIFRTQLLGLYITPDETEESILAAENTLAAGLDYLNVILWGLLPFAVSSAYAGMLRVTGEARLPMVASIVSVLTNLLFNWLLIFGKCGFPCLGAKGAAIATVISRFVEMLIMVCVAHSRFKKRGMYVFLHNAYSSVKIPFSLFKRIFIKGAPLLINELLWSGGMAALTRQYSLKGLTVVAAMNITSTLSNLFNVFFVSMGTAVSVLVGRALGADDFDGARDIARKIAVFELMICVATGIVLYICAPFLPRVYTEATVAAKELAAELIRICALITPLSGFAHVSYFILRAGGKTMITFLFDSGYTWIVPVPAAWLLVRFSGLNIVAIYAIVQSLEIIKDIVGYILVKKGVWIQNIAKAK